MNRFAIMRFEKCKKGSLAGREKHDERKKEAYKSNKDIDLSRSHLNYHLVGAPKSTYLRFCQERIQTVGCPRVRKDSTYAVETLYTASPEFLGSMTSEQQRQYFQHCLAYAQQTFGKENIISAVVHMDESTPHMHLLFVPITKDGRLSAKDILGNAKSLTKHQDQFYAYMHRFYPKLERGESAAETGRRHVPTWLIKEAPRMQKLFLEMEKAVDEISLLNIGKQRELLKKLLKRMIPKLKSYVSEVDLLKRSIDRQDYDIARLTTALDMERSKTRSLEQSLSDVIESNNYITALLNRIPPDIREEAIREFQTESQVSQKANPIRRRQNPAL